MTGRVDDLMNVSGHLLSTAEIESALAAHEKVGREGTLMGTIFARLWGYGSPLREITVDPADGAPIVAQVKCLRCPHIGISRKLQRAPETG